MDSFFTREYNSALSVLEIALFSLCFVPSSRSLTEMGFLQSQSLRMSRCAMIALMEAGRRKACIPMLRIRVIVSAAEFV
jgi:hypothetical protein